MMCDHFYKFMGVFLSAKPKTTIWSLKKFRIPFSESKSGFLMNESFWDLKSLYLNQDFRIYERRRSFHRRFEIDSISQRYFQLGHISWGFFHAGILVYAMWGKARSKFVNLPKINTCMMAYIAKTQAFWSVSMLFYPKSYEISQLRVVFLFCLFMFYYYFKSFVVLLNGYNSASWVQSCEGTFRACSRLTNFILYIKLNTIVTSWWILWGISISLR